MKTRAYLIVSNKGNLRLNKTGAGVRSNELAIRLELDVPDRFFTRPVPVVTLAIPDAAVPAADVDAVITITADTVAAALGLAVSDVRDGLTNLLAQRKDIAS